MGFPSEREDSVEQLGQVVAILFVQLEAAAVRPLVRQDQRFERPGLVVVPSRVGLRCELQPALADPRDHLVGQVEAFGNRLESVQMHDQIGLAAARRGKEAVLGRVIPILEVMGKTITLVGPVGSGQVTKAINQVIIAGTYAAVAEGMAIGLAAGIDIEAAHKAVSGGAAGSWVLTNRAGNMIKNDYPLGFRTRLHRKDLNIALEAARELGVAIPVAALVEQMETSLLKRGFGDEDVSNMARIVRELAGIAE